MVQDLQQLWPSACLVASVLHELSFVMEKRIVQMEKMKHDVVSFVICKTF